MEEPEEGESDAQAIQRSWSNPAPLSCSRAEGIQEPGRDGVGNNRQKRKQEGISEGSQEEEFVARGPAEKPGTFESQFAFIITNGHLHLPATSIRQHNLPGEVGSMSGLGGEQVPGRLTFASGNHQPKRLVVSRVEDGES